MAPPAGFLLSVAISILLSTVAAQNSVISSRNMDILEINDFILNKGLQDFALNLFTRTVTEHGGNENICISPISIWTMLSVLLEGADGSTRDQLRRVLNYDTVDERSRAKDDKAIRRRFKKIKTALNITTTAIKIECVDTVFVNGKQNILLPEYAELIRREYDSHLHTLDFSSSKASKLINNYIDKQTRGKIIDIVRQSDLSETNMVLVSAAFFEGQWQTPFIKSDTVRDDFFNEQGQIVGTVDMMNQKLPLPFENMKNLQANVVKLPYGDGTQFSMLVIVPHNAIPLSTVMANLQKISLTEIDAQLEKSFKMFPFDDIDISIPRFSITTNVHLRDMLKNMGLLDAFDPSNANFSKMFGDSQSYVSKIIHKAKIEVNEEGTVASGAVYLDLVNKSSGPSIIANKPFIYLIVEHTTCNMVFAGTYVSPP